MPDMSHDVDIIKTFKCNCCHFREYLQETQSLWSAAELPVAGEYKRCAQRFEKNVENVLIRYEQEVGLKQEVGYSAATMEQKQLK